MIVATLLLLLPACSLLPHPGRRQVPAPGNSQGQSDQSTSLGNNTTPLPATSHLVLVMEENHSFQAIMSSKQAVFIHHLAASGALLTNYHAIAHPSQPNYLALFSGSTQGVTSDHCPQQFKGPNLASELHQAHLTFTGYAEALPAPGSKRCSSSIIPGLGAYARKHNPWVDFTSVPASDNQPFSHFPSDFSKLPSVAMVIPSQQHDMHSGSIQAADQWLAAHLSSYASWAKQHHSLLVIAWDEADHSSSNQVAAIVFGQGIKPGRYNQPYTHYSLLRTVEDLFHLPTLGHSQQARPFSEIWQLANPTS